MRKILCKASIIIPLIMLYEVLMSRLTISIPELNLYLGRWQMIPYFTVVTVGWLCCSPFRKNCYNGRWPEVLFNLVPVELLLMLVFAQWHFKIFIGKVILLLLLEVWFFIYLRREEAQYRYTRRRHRMYKNAFRRGTVLAAFVVSLVPCFLSVFVFKLRSPVYEAREEIVDRILSETAASEGEDAIENDVYQENQELLLCFDEERWEKYDVDEKITIVQKLVDFEAGRLGVPAATVASQLLDEFTLGLYDIDTKEIWINLEYLDKSPAKECVETICHETYHSSQHYLVENLDWENEALLQSAYFEELRAWKDNRDNYQNAAFAGFDAYESQPLEASAREYAREETEKILSYTSPVQIPQDQ